MAVLHGIEMNVIGVSREISLVTQGMLPIAPLPNPALAFACTACGNPFAYRQLR
jgi:hypothetical protein